MPSFSIPTIAFDVSRMRMTTFSPYCAGSVATRRSIALAGGLRGDAAVLRDAALGDVEVGEDLDAGGDRGDRRRGHDRRLGEHAVDAVADPHLVLLRLEVDVGGAALDGLLDHPLDELDDGRVLAGRAEVHGRRREVVERALRLRRPDAGSSSSIVSISGAAPLPLPQFGSARRPTTNSMSAGEATAGRTS